MNSTGDSSDPILRFALIIDDQNEKDSRFVKVLQDLKFDIRFARNGIEAVAFVMEKQRAKEPIDMIMLDLSLGDIGGIEAAKRLRAANYKGPLFGFSINVTGEMIKQAKEVGIDHCFMRSTFTKELANALIATYLK